MKKSQISVNDLKMNTISTQAAFDLFDSLLAPQVEDLYGLWKGSDIKTGHPLEGYLTAAGWYGKFFKSNESVFPLIMKRGNGKLYALNPKLLPLSLPFQKLPLQVIRFLGKLAPLILRTKKSSARLRQVQYRDSLCPAMIYNDKAIIDIFKQYDRNTLVCLMDTQCFNTKQPYFFLLERFNKQPLD